MSAERCQWRRITRSESSAHKRSTRSGKEFSPNGVVVHLELALPKQRLSSKKLKRVGKKSSQRKKQGEQNHLDVTNSNVANKPNTLSLGLPSANITSPDSDVQSTGSEETVSLMSDAVGNDSRVMNLVSQVKDYDKPNGHLPGVVIDDKNFNGRAVFDWNSRFQDKQTLLFLPACYSSCHTDFYHRMTAAASMATKEIKNYDHCVSKQRNHPSGMIAECRSSLMAKQSIDFVVKSAKVMVEVLVSDFVNDASMVDIQKTSPATKMNEQIGVLCQQMSDTLNKLFMLQETVDCMVCNALDNLYEERNSAPVE